MNHIRTRNDIMAFLEGDAPNPTIARAMQEGEAELLGVFRRIPPEHDMGWIVEVTSRHGTVYHVAIKTHKFTYHYRCHMVSRVPWEWWMGDVSDGIIGPESNQSKPLYAGDNPEIYEEMKFYETKE